MKITTFNEGESLNADKLSQLVDADLENKLLADSVCRGQISAGATWASTTINATPTNIFTEKFYLSSTRNLKVVLKCDWGSQTNGAALYTNKLYFDFFLDGTRVNSYETMLRETDNTLGAIPYTYHYALSYAFPLIDIPAGPHSMILQAYRTANIDGGINVLTYNIGAHVLDMGQSVT